MEFCFTQFIIEFITCYPSINSSKNNNLPLLDEFLRPYVKKLLNTYVHNARMLNPGLIPDKISPHTLRQSKAMNLLQTRVNLIYIRNILGHVSIQTTEIYARVDFKLKREALEATYVNVIPDLPAGKSWGRDSKLMEWLMNLTK